MDFRVRDIVSYQGHDYVVEGLLSYRLQGKAYPLARAVEGAGATARVLFIEPLLGEGDDRVLVLREVADFETGAPPPAVISYESRSYVPRSSGTYTVDVAGAVPGRAPSVVEVWRYRAAGDYYVQVERWGDKTVVLAGESVHGSMLEVFPAK